MLVSGREPTGLRGPPMPGKRARRRYRSQGRTIENVLVKRKIEVEGWRELSDQESPLQV